MNREQEQHDNNNPFRTPFKGTEAATSKSAEGAGASSRSDSPSQSNPWAFSNRALKQMQKAGMNIY